MNINPIQNLSVSEAITAKLEILIIEGVLKPGDSLPPERQLAKDYGVSRASLRQAIGVLEARGLIVSRQGGGNYVCDVVKNSFADPLLDLMKRHGDLKFQIIELRQTLECSAAYFAAERATPQDKKNIQKCLEDLRTIIPCHQPEEEAKADLALHLAIADAAHNAPLSLMIRNIYSLLLNEIEENLTLMQQHELRNARLHSQHEEMARCVIAGDSEGARRAVEDHLKLIKDSFIESGNFAKRNEVAEIRNYLNEL